MVKLITNRFVLILVILFIICKVDADLSCSEGQYLSDKLECELCQPGTYQDETGQTVCKSCPAGYQCPNEGMTSVDDTYKCKQGTYSVGGAATSCSVCQPGTYQNETGQSVCKSWPAGYQCPEDGMTSVNDTYKCDAGTYSVGSASSCSNCPAGYYCPDEGM